MIKRVITIFLLTYLFFIFEIVLNDVLGAWAKPQLLLLLVVFWGLYSGIRYSIFVGVLAGLLKDIYSLLPFGTYLFVFIAAAYLTTLIRQNLYQPGSRFSRAVVAFFVLVGTFIIQIIFYLMHHDPAWKVLLLNIFLPQLVITMALVTFVFQALRNLAGFFKL